MPAASSRAGGLYFAHDPGYSHNYATTAQTAAAPGQGTLAADEREIMAVKL